MTDLTQTSIEALVQEMRAALTDVETANFHPTRILVSRRNYIRLARLTMSKRQFRRWCGRLKEARRR